MFFSIFFRVLGLIWLALVHIREECCQTQATAQVPYSCQDLLTWFPDRDVISDTHPSGESLWLPTWTPQPKQAADAGLATPAGPGPDNRKYNVGPISAVGVQWMQQKQQRCPGVLWWMREPLETDGYPPTEAAVAGREDGCTDTAATGIAKATAIATQAWQGAERRWNSTRD